MAKYKVTLNTGPIFYMAPMDDMTPEQVFWYMDVKRSVIASVQKIED